METKNRITNQLDSVDANENKFYTVNIEYEIDVLEYEITSHDSVSRFPTQLHRAGVSLA